MKKIWTKYSGVILLYSVIVGGLVLLDARFKYLNEKVILEERNYYVAIGD